MPYAEHETRPEGQLAVLFFRQTYGVRLFETEGRLYERAASDRKSLRREVFLEAADLPKVMSLPVMLIHLEALTTAPARVTHDARDRWVARPDLDPRSPPSVARALWEVLQAVGDKVLKKPQASRSRKNVFQVDLQFATSPEGAEALAKMPRQARVLSSMVVSLNKSSVDEDEMRGMVEHLHKVGTLKTKSDPWTIFRFYAPQFYDMGLMRYQGRRVEETDEDQAEAA